MGKPGQGGVIDLVLGHHLNSELPGPIYLCGSALDICNLELPSDYPAKST